MRAALGSVPALTDCLRGGTTLMLRMSALHEATWHGQCGIVPLRLHSGHIWTYEMAMHRLKKAVGEAPDQHPGCRSIREAVDRRPVARTERGRAREKKVRSCFAFSVAVVQHPPWAADVRLSHSSTGWEYRITSGLTGLVGIMSRMTRSLPSRPGRTVLGSCRDIIPAGG